MATATPTSFTDKVLVSDEVAEFSPAIIDEMKSHVAKYPADRSRSALIPLLMLLQRERGWIVERDGENVGSVFVVEKSTTIAQLRLLIVAPAARGAGIGRRLVAECIAFARGAGYRKLMLWTNGGLDAARHLYEEAGFRLTREERHRSFGKDLVGQTFVLDLARVVAAQGTSA